MAVALLDGVTITAELVVCVSTHKVDSRQLQFLVTLTAVLLIEILTGSLHPQHIFPHRVDTLSHLLYPRSVNFTLLVDFTFKVRLNHSLLVFELLDQEGGQNIKFDL